MRLSGRMERPSSTFPLLMPVNTMYQSVHGVTRSMRRPIRMSTESGKNMIPSRYARIGVKRKFIASAAPVKRMLAKDPLTLRRSTDRNRTNRSIIKNISTAVDGAAPRGVTSPRTIPMIAAAMINMGCPLPIRSIRFPLLI